MFSQSRRVHARNAVLVAAFSEAPTTPALWKGVPSWYFVSFVVYVLYDVEGWNPGGDLGNALWHQWAIS